MTTRLWHTGKRLPSGELDPDAWVEGELVKPGIGLVTLMNDSGVGWVDIASPRDWGREATGGEGFARKYNELGQPIFSNHREFAEACRKANDHGDSVAPIRARDYDVGTGL